MIMASILDGIDLKSLIAFVPPQYQGIAAIGLPILMQILNNSGVSLTSGSPSAPTPAPESGDQVAVLKRIATAFEGMQAGLEKIAAALEKAKE
jgi:hypothetical protein